MTTRFTSAADFQRWLTTPALHAADIGNDRVPVRDALCAATPLRALVPGVNLMPYIDGDDDAADTGLALSPGPDLHHPVIATYWTDRGWAPTGLALHPDVFFGIVFAVLAAEATACDATIVQPAVRKGILPRDGELKLALPARLLTDHTVGDATTLARRLLAAALLVANTAEERVRPIAAQYHVALGDPLD